MTFDFAQAISMRPPANTDAKIMIRSALLAGFLAISLLDGHASEAVHRMSLRLRDSDFHRYPPRTLFTPDGKLVIAYRTAKSSDESSTLQVVVADGRSGKQIAKHSYDIPSAGRTKISDNFVPSLDGHSLYYVELTGNPIVLEISPSNLEVLSESTTRPSNAASLMPRVANVTDDALAQVEARIKTQNGIDDFVILSSGRLIGMKDRAIAGSLQLFDREGNLVKTLDRPDCGFKSVQLSPSERYGAAVCTRTGTTEWTFGKTLDRNVFIIDLQTMLIAKSVSLSKMSLQTSIATNASRVWYPQPTIWDSGQMILLCVPDFSGTITIQEIIPELTHQ